MPKPDGLIYKDFIGEIKEINEKENTLTSFVSTNSVDRMGEVLDPSGADLSNYRKNPVVLWAHDYSQPPIGKALWAKRSGDGILAKMEFAPTAFAQEIKKLYQEKFLNTFSVGFIPKNWVDGKSQKDPARTYTQWEMLEYSAVPVPANPDALALAMQKQILTIPELIKSLDVKDDWDELSEKKEEIAVIEKTDGLEELLAENVQLKEQLAASEKENGDLRFKLYQSLLKNQKQISEIAGRDFVAEAHEIITGAIRKAQGKIT